MDCKFYSIKFVGKTLATTVFTFNLNDSEGVTFEGDTTGAESKDFTIDCME